MIFRTPIPELRRTPNSVAFMVCTGGLVLLLAACGRKEEPKPIPEVAAPKAGASVESILAPSAPADSAALPPGQTSTGAEPAQPAVDKEEPIHPLSERDVAMLNYAVSQFRQNLGRNPKNLQEMVQARFLPRLPQTDPSERLLYDASSGRMRVEKISK